MHDRPDSLIGQSEEARQAIFDEYEALQALPGVVRVPLKASSAIKVRSRDGERTVDHDPLDDVLLAGFYLLDTDDHEHTIDIVGHIPAAARLGGTVAIQPLISE